MDYQTVYDITLVGYKEWTGPAYGICFVLLITVLIVIRHTFAVTTKKFPSKFVLYSGLVFTFLWTAIVFGTTFSDYQTLRNAVEEGRGKVVEGEVGYFKPMPKEGKTNERFCVADVCFEYSDYYATAGFNNAASLGGPIRVGLPVRVTYFNGKITKLEVKR
jgi:hypothetical protein